MSISFCPGALCAMLTAAFLALDGFFSIWPHVARADSARRRIMFGNASIALATLSLLACGASSASAQLTFNIINQGTATPQMMTGFAQAVRSGPPT